MNVISTLYDRPQTPDEDSCCGNACNPCIFDIHKELLEKWERRKNVNRVEKKNLLVPLSYKLFYVDEVEIINSSYLIMRLRSDEGYESNVNIFLHAGQHVMINILSWSKPFTPIDWSNNTLKLLIRVYSSGLNTKKLKDIQLGTEIKVRGPYGDFQYIRNSFTSIIMFCIGSGIAALYPIAKSIVDDEMDETRIHLNIGFQSVDQVPLMKELKLLTDFWNVICKLYITQQDKPQHISGIDVECGRINKNIFESAIEKRSPDKTLILICGNNKFNESLETWSKKYCFIHCHVFK